MAFSAWSTTAASNTNALTGVNFDENQAPSTVNDAGRELMAQLKAAVVDLTSSQTLTNKNVVFPVNNQSADYTLVLSDAGKCIVHVSTDNNSRTFTIPANASVAYNAGTVLYFVNASLAQMTIAINSDTLYWHQSGTGRVSGSITVQGGKIAIAIKTASTEWVITNP